MMEPYNGTDIQELPLSIPLFRRKVVDFLGMNGLRLEEVDLYLAVMDPDGNLLAGGGLQGDVLKCIAVSESVRSAGLAAPLVSRLVAAASERGVTNLKVYTKPENRAVFESLGFRTLAEAPLAILMENGRGLEDCCRYLESFRGEGISGAVVMNANPFTEGHLYLIRRAAAEVDRLFVLPVREDVSDFSYAERKGMISSVPLPPNVMVLEGNGYAVSRATFPTYFLKDLSGAAPTQMALDLDLFARRIAPALGVTVRFAGSEPADPLTAAYNETMKAVLPGHGIEVREVERLADGEGPVSASRVRKSLAEGRFGEAAALTPAPVWKYLVAALMERSLRMELDTPSKPGLVGPGTKGGHADMDHALMSGSIRTLRASFLRHFDPADPVATGKAVEADVLSYTRGVNTYRGAIFSQILFATAFLQLLAGLRLVKMHQTKIGKCLGDSKFASRLQERIAALAGTVEPSDRSHGGSLVARFGVKGALPMALDGYGPLFGEWLPFFRSIPDDPFRNQKTLLKIMSTLDDTCILYRAGRERAEAVKAEAAALLEHFDGALLEETCARYAAEGLSPGGCADMLALTVLADSLLS